MWGHVFDEDLEPARAEGGTVRGDGEATLVAEDIDAGHRGRDPGADAARPEQGIPGSPRTRSGEGFQKLFELEQTLTDEFNSPWNRFKRFVAEHAFIAALGIAALAWAIVLLLQFLARERDAGVPEYLAEPPDDATPALAYALAHEGRTPTTPSSRPCSTSSTAATTTPRRRPPRTRSSTSRSRRRADRPAGELTPYEQEVLAFFDQLLDGESVPMSEMKDKIPAALGDLARRAGSG